MASPVILYPSRLARFNIGAGGIATFTLASYTSWLITKLHIVVQTTSVSDLIIVYLNGQEFDLISPPPAGIATSSYRLDYWMTLLESDSPGLAIQSTLNGTASGFFTGYTFSPSS